MKIWDEAADVPGPFMIDIHCHVLPGVDDGADSWDTAVEMCRMAAADGITHMVATPHANDQFAYERERHAEAIGKLHEISGGTPQLILGCDFHFSYENVQSLLAGKAKYTIGDTRYLLIELSDYSIPPQMRNTLLHLISIGVRPVLTHPERNLLLQRSPEQVVAWADSGCIVQLTANSLTGFWGKTAQKTSRCLLERSAVHVVASDAHDTRHRPPLLSPARAVLTQWIGEEIAQALVEQNPGAIVRNEELPYFPPPAI